MDKVTVGAETICRGCIFGRVIRCLSVPNPAEVANEAAKPYSEVTFVNIEDVDSYCLHPLIAENVAKEMGNILACELFLPRSNNFNPQVIENEIG